MFDDEKQTNPSPTTATAQNDHSSKVPPNESSEQNPQPVGRASFRHLFLSWTPQELPVLLPAVAASLLLAGSKAAYTVILGRVFDVVAALGRGSNDDDMMVVARNTIAVWCLALTGLGAFKAVAASCFMGQWILHGETRVRAVRRALFQALLAKEMAWFDTRVGGMASLLTALNTYVSALPFPRGGKV